MRQDTLSRQIAADVLKKQRPMDINRAAFLALRDDIVAAMEDGWPVKRIWETLRDQGKISFSYPAFTGYVNRLILREQQQDNRPIEKPTQKPPPATTKQSNTTTKPPEPPKPRPVNTSSELRGFHHDPTSLTLDDLL